MGNRAVAPERSARLSLEGSEVTANSQEVGEMGGGEWG